MNNEEKILAMLAEIKATQEKQGEMLERHDATLSDLQKTVTRVAVTQENVVLPNLQLLAEGHDTLLSTLARKDRVEALEDDVALLKAVIKTMSQRITDLEKAGSETA